MKAGQVQVVGITRNVSEKGISYTLHGITPFEDWEANSDRGTSVGFKTISEWTRVDLSDIKPQELITLRYGKGFQGKAVLVGYDRVAPSK